MENALYLIQVSACTSVFYFLYLVVFRNSTFFRANRIYLLAALLFSFIIPVLDFSMVAADYHLPANAFLSTKTLPVLNNIKSGYLGTMSASENVNFILLIYSGGFGFMMLRLIYSIARLTRLKARAGICRNGAVRIVRTDLPQPFSFFNLIFLPKGEVNPLIVEHEKAHVRYHHWIDLLMLEISGAILWFNPILVFYKRSIKIQHEYEADHHVIQNGSDVPHYLECIIHHLQSENLGIPISQFYSQNIKKRIIMMTRKKTPIRFSLLYVLFIPAACLLLFAFAKPSIRSITFSNVLIADKDGNVVIIVDPGHGGDDAGGTGKEGVSEKEFAMAMARNIQKAGELKNIKVILTRTDDKSMNLEERVSLAKGYNADAFISIHTNYDPENAKSSGIECVVSEENSRFRDSKNLAENIQREFHTLNGIALNGIKESNSYVLSKNSIPAVLLELGYFSNSMDYDYLNDQKNQQQISERIIAAVMQYTK
jgi:N-acetylmuramoyl-L-alanine amidase